jgi:hypothetical protein
MKQDYELILLAACRYALGRKTYIVGTVVDYLLKEWKDISGQLKAVIQVEIKEAIESGNAGMDMDVGEWKRLLSL